MELLFSMSAAAADENRALAQALRVRDPEVLDRLIEEYQYRLLRYLVSLTGARALAEDLFQETWIRVLERGRQYDPRYRFEPWLFAIARNLFLDRVRRRPEVTLGLIEENGEETVELADTASASPYDLFRQEEAHRGVAQAMRSLAPMYREILSLRFQEELGLEEIAAVAGIPLATVKTRLYRALARLQARLPREMKP